MKVKELVAAQFQVVAVMDGDTCPAEDFLFQGEADYEANRDGLLVLLEHAAQHGLDGLPSKLLHEVDKKNKIYEFKKGQLRLFFFKGSNGQIAVCTAGLIKKTQKADKGAVKAAARHRTAYLAAVANRTLEVMKDETE